MMADDRDDDMRQGGAWSLPLADIAVCNICFQFDFTLEKFLSVTNNTDWQHNTSSLLYSFTHLKKEKQ